MTQHSSNPELLLRDPSFRHSKWKQGSEALKAYDISMTVPCTRLMGNRPTPFDTFKQKLESKVIPFCKSYSPPLRAAVQFIIFETEKAPRFGPPRNQTASFKRQDIKM
ncbi:hypothetical protein P5673_031733 [Acropora cervicornis]|uniref:Uncharacterized protein n=1 Tax=Acropora cervicornis TaxID=6130 RepID=A0AAD9PS97_ACRCE|nr:hypothetical protein P5673_031733 [Acropora cervicornis]